MENEQVNNTAATGMEDPAAQRSGGQAGVQRRKIACCQDVRGFGGGRELPDYSQLLPILRDALYKCAFEEGCELEFRLGNTVVKGRSKHFTPGVQEDMFKTILKTLLTGSWESHTRVVEQDLIQGDTRVTLAEDGRVKRAVTKRPLWAQDIEMANGPFDFRISAASEVDVTARLGPTELQNLISMAKIRRLKDRQSFVYKFWRFDLTLVQFDTHANDAVDAGVVYEVELEVKGGAPLDRADHSLYLAESSILKVLDIAYMVEPGLRAKDVSFSYRPVKIRRGREPPPGQ